MSTEAEAISLGPLIADRYGCHVQALSGRGCHFGQDGIRRWDEEEAHTFAWREIADVVVRGPTWANLIPVIPGLLELFGPAGHRPLYVYVNLLHRTQGAIQLNLGKPPQGPYPYRELDAQEAVVSELAERSRLEVIGTPEFMDLLRECRSGASHLTALTQHRVRVAVDRFLA